ncbi:hypothetical protein VTK26DRAFT_1215 [Humicola hyalothermophila]
MRIALTSSKLSRFEQPLTKQTSSVSAVALPRSLPRYLAIKKAHQLPTLLQHRPLISTPTMSTPEGTKGGKPDTAKRPDWSPSQYLLFQDARNRPIQDLIAFLGPSFSPSRIIDLGCGPGNSTSLLAARFPDATITGVDSSPAMLAAARKAIPDIDFVLADVRTYTPPIPASPHAPSPPEPTTAAVAGGGPTLLFSNAVFHWLRRADRIPTIVRLLRALPRNSGSVLALQMPDNHDEPSHRCMRETAAAAGTPWRAHFDLSPSAAAQQEPESGRGRVGGRESGLEGEGGREREGERPDLDPIEPVLEYYDALAPHCARIEMWTTRYVHALAGHRDIVEWVRGTGLQPFVNALPPEGGVREGFLREYERRLEREYPRSGTDGKVLLEYPRRFVVAWR